MSRRKRDKPRPTAVVPPAPVSAPPSHRLVGVVAPLLLLALYAGLSLTAIAGKSNTFDEVAHLTAGYTYWEFDAYRLQPENGNLPQRWGAIPLLAGDYKLPPTTDPMWKMSEVFRYGRKFFFEQGNDTARMLLSARAMMLLMGVACGAVVYFWSRRLFGPVGGLVSLGLFAFCPTMLAHGPLITSDITAALFFLLALAAIWRLMHRVDGLGIVLCGLAVGGLALAKFSAPLIAPMAAIMLGARLLSRQPLTVKLWRQWSEQRWWAQAAIILGALAVQTVIVLVVVWAAYGFRYSGSGETAFISGQENFYEPWSRELENNTFTTRAVGLARDWRLLPEAYLYGFAYTVKHAEARQAFMNGEFSIFGWRTFFPYAVLVKTPLTVFAMILVAAAAAWLRWRKGAVGAKRAITPLLRGLYATAPLWALLVVYWPTAIMSNLNIGHRHVLMTYPVMYILAGAAAWLLTERRRLGLGIVGGLLAIHLAISVWVWPNYLAFFNLAAGGPSRGYTRLVDSSLDWGQDVPALARWFRDHNSGPDRQPAYVAYFGTGDLGYWHVDAQPLLHDPYRDALPPAQVFAPLGPGIYAISATYVQGVYLPTPGPWTPAYENAYQSLKQINTEHVALLQDPAALAKLQQKYGDQNLNVYFNYPGVRLARLAAWLRTRMQPIDNAGHSILIYKLTAEDLRQALDGPPPYKM